MIDAIKLKAIEETEKSALILPRRGQGLFKQRVRQVERRCRITGVERIEHLRASHCKGANLIRGGREVVSPVAHGPSLERMGVPAGERVNVGGFPEGQRRYFEFHRERVFLEARGGR